MDYILLGFAICSELVGSTMMKLSEGFSKKLPIIGVVVGYVSSFYVFSIALRTIPLGLGYAIWSGVGTILTVMAGIFLFKEKISRKGYAGIAILIVGLVLLNIAE